MGTTTKLSFADYAALDPAVAALEKLAARAALSADGDPDYMVFLREVKPLVVALAGWHRGPSGARIDNALQVDAMLSTTEAYDAVYQHLVDVMGRADAGS